jgi:hypothetical protein
MGLLTDRRASLNVNVQCPATVMARRALRVVALAISGAGAGRAQLFAMVPAGQYHAGNFEARAR